MPDIFGSAGNFAKLGEVLSVASAFVWAVSIVLFRVAGEKISAVAMNLFKNVLAAVLLVPTMLVLGRSIPPAVSASSVLWLLASGLIGIAVSDTLFFMALHRLGAELTAIVDCAYAPFVIILSFLVLGERMNTLQSFGVVLIVAAVLLIAGKRSDARLSRGTLVSGIVLGIVALFFQAAGIVMFKPLLKDTPVLWATFVRMAGGAVGVAVLISVHPRRRAILRPLAVPAHWKLLVPASLLAAYVSNVIWMGGMKYTLASIASGLNQLNTVFIFILAAVFLKEKITPLKLAAMVFAFTGAMLVSIPL